MNWIIVTSKLQDTKGIEIHQATLKVGESAKEVGAGPVIKNKSFDSAARPGRRNPHVILWQTRKVIIISLN